MRNRMQHCRATLRATQSALGQARLGNQGRPVWPTRFKIRAIDATSGLRFDRGKVTLCQIAKW